MEAAVVVPLVWIVIFLVLSLNFYVHQRAWYTQIACEAVITGSGQGAYKGRNAAEEAEKGRPRQGPRSPGLPRHRKRKRS